MRRAWRHLKNVWAGIVIAVLVPVLVWRLVSLLFGMIWRRRRTRETFRSSLLRAGLSRDEAEQLTDRYHARITVREIMQQRRLLR
jgi:hypothetical protein